MQEWNYNELKEHIDEIFETSINDGLNALQAGGRCLYELLNVIEDGYMEKTIIYMKDIRINCEKLYILVADSILA